MPTVIYKDDYNIRYEVEYEYKDTPTGQVLDITTKVYDPRVYGEPPRGYVSNHKTYVQGLVSITRQVIRPEEDGYVIIAQGGTQTKAEMQIDGYFFSDRFKYKLDHNIVADESGIVDDGSAFVDIDDTLNDCIWANVDAFGNILPYSGNVLTFIDVW